MIYESSNRKYELSTKETVLRKTVVKGEGSYEILYERVKNQEEIDNVEFNSERWERRGGGNKYIVFEQLTAKGKRTGYIKVAPKSKATMVFFNIVEVKKSDWMYYRRRRTGK